MMSVNKLQGSVEVALEWPKEFSSLKEIDRLLRCAICYEFLDISMMVSKCSHNYCSVCIRRYISYKPECPACRESATAKDLCSNRILDELVEHFSKIRCRLLTALDSYCTSNPESSEHESKSTPKFLENGEATKREICREVLKDSQNHNGLKPHSPIPDKSRASAKRKRAHEMSDSDSSDSDILCLSDDEWCPSDNSSDFDKPWKKKLSSAKKSKIQKKSKAGSATKVTPPPQCKAPPSRCEAPPSRCEAPPSRCEAAPHPSCEAPPTNGTKYTGKLLNETNMSGSSSVNCPSLPALTPHSEGQSSLLSPPRTVTSSQSSHTPVQKTPSNKICSTPTTTAVQKVPCPVCAVEVPERNINLHLDRCLNASAKKESLRTTKRKPLPKFVYGLMNDKEIRRKLTEAGLPTQGTRQVMINRHKEFTLLYNSQCDALNPKSAEEIVQEMLRNEKQKSVAAAFNPGAGKLQLEKGATKEQVEQAQKSYVNTHKSHFAQLIAAARKSAQRKVPLPSLKHESTDDAQVPNETENSNAPPQGQAEDSNAPPQGQAENSNAPPHGAGGVKSTNKISDNLTTPEKSLKSSEIRNKTDSQGLKEADSMSRTSCDESANCVSEETHSLANKRQSSDPVSSSPPCSPSLLSTSVCVEAQPSVTSDNTADQCDVIEEARLPAVNSSDLFPSYVSDTCVLAVSDDSNQSCGQQSRMSEFSTDLPLTQASRSMSPVISPADSDSLFANINSSIDRKDCLFTGRSDRNDLHTDDDLGLTFTAPKDFKEQDQNAACQTGVNDSVVTTKKAGRTSKAKVKRSQLLEVGAVLDEIVNETGNAEGVMTRRSRRARKQ